MQIRPELALQAALKSLTEVIAPALDPADKMAQEQIGLVIGLLTLVKTRLPIAFAYNCDELVRLVGLAETIGPAAASQSLAHTLGEGAATLARAQASPHDVEHAIDRLRTEIGRVAGELAMQRHDAARVAVRAILDASSAQLLRERSWVLMQGWETDPGSLPLLETLIDTQRDAETGR
jgi:hypothetical protein